MAASQRTGAAGWGLGDIGLSCCHLQCQSLILIIVGKYFRELILTYFEHRENNMGPHVRIPFIDFMSNGGERSETFNLNVMRSGESSGSVFLPSLCISSRQTYFSSFGIHQIHPKLLSEYNFLQYDQPDLYGSRSETLSRKVELNSGPIF